MGSDPLWFFGGGYFIYFILFTVFYSLYFIPVLFFKSVENKRGGGGESLRGSFLGKG